VCEGVWRSRLFALPGFVSWRSFFFLFHFSIKYRHPYYTTVSNRSETKDTSCLYDRLLLAVTGATASILPLPSVIENDRRGHKPSLLLTCSIKYSVDSPCLARNISQLLRYFGYFSDLPVGGNLPTMNALVGKLTQRKAMERPRVQAPMTSPAWRWDLSCVSWPPIWDSAGLSSSLVPLSLVWSHNLS